MGVLGLAAASSMRISPRFSDMGVPGLTRFFPWVTRSKKPIGRVSTAERGREGSRGGVSDPGVVGAEAVVVRRRGAAMYGPGIMSCVSMRLRSSKKLRSSWPRVSLLVGAQAGNGHMEGSRKWKEEADGMTRGWRVELRGYSAAGRLIQLVERVGRAGPAEGGERRAAAPKSTKGPAT